MSNYYTLQNAIISGVLSQSIDTGTAVKIIDSTTEYIQPVTAVTDDWCGVLMGTETVTNASGSTCNVALKTGGNVVKVKLGSTAYKGQALITNASGIFVSGSYTLQNSGSTGPTNTWKISDAIALQSGVTNDLIIAKIK